MAHAQEDLVELGAHFHDTPGFDPLDPRPELRRHPSSLNLALDAASTQFTTSWPARADPVPTTYSHVPDNIPWTPHLSSYVHVDPTPGLHPYVASRDADGGPAFPSQLVTVPPDTARQQDLPSPSSSSASWVNLTPKTTSPPPELVGPVGPATLSRDGSDDDKQGKNIGPSKTWELPERPKRGRKATAVGAADRVLPNKRVAKAKAKPKRTGPLDPLVRESAAQTKKLGACRRCHYKKMRCVADPSDPATCWPCKKMVPAPSSTLSCYRYSINDASLYREQKAPYAMFSKRWKSMDLIDIENWASDEVRTLFISQVFIEAPYEVRVRKFLPEEGDMLEEVWRDGDVARTYTTPPYAIVNMGEAAASIRSMMRNNAAAKYVNCLVVSKRGPDLFSESYLQVFREICSKPPRPQEELTLLQNTLDLWMACRFTSYPEGIVGEDTLGMERVQDSSSPWRETVPAPPVMVAQLECIFYSQFLRPLSLQVLRQLDTMLQSRRPQCWLTVYLTMFLLLHSCSMLTERDKEHARRMGLEETYANPEAIRAHHCGATTLLAHYHQIVWGAYPFRLAAEGRLAEFHNFSEQQTKFIRSIAVETSQMSNKLREIRQSGDASNQLYWVLQLYDTNWSPDKMD